MCTCSSMAQGEARIGRARIGGGEGWEVQGCLQWKALARNPPARCRRRFKIGRFEGVLDSADLRWLLNTLGRISTRLDHLKQVERTLWPVLKTLVQTRSDNIPLYHQQDCLLSSMPDYLHSSSQPCMCLHNPEMGTALSALLTPLSCHGGGGACVRWGVVIVGRHVSKTPCTLPPLLLLYLRPHSSAALPVGLFVSGQQSSEWKASSAELLEVSCLNQLGLAGRDTLLELYFLYIFSILSCHFVILHLDSSCIASFLHPLHAAL